MNKLKNILVFSLVFGLVLQPAVLSAQGFKKLQINDKFGKPVDSSSEDPIEPIQDGNQEAGDQDANSDNCLEGTPPPGMICLNGTDLDIKQMIEQISALTGKNFIIDDKVKGKITILSDKPMTKEMAYQAFLSALEINGLTPVMTPAGLINIVQQQQSLSKPLDLYTGTSPVTDKYITRIIQLNNISANEISQVIKPMGSKNGSMFAYPTTNSIIVTDTGSNIDHILKLIKELDQEGPQEVLDMIPIIHADAKTIADQITQIFEKGDDKNAAANARRNFMRSRVRGGQTELEDVQQISKVIADERTNSILIMGTKRSLLKVRALVARLDRSISGAEGRIHVYYLRYAKAKEVSEVLASLVADAKTKPTAGAAKGAAAKTTAATASSGAVTLEGGVKVTADESTNSLIVVASAKDYKTLVDNVIKKLDLLRPQVYLESVIMSLDVTKSNTLGFSGLLGNTINDLAGGDSLQAFGALLPVPPTAISTIASASGGLAGGVIGDRTIDFTLADGSTASVPGVSGIIMALSSNTDANVLSTPSILTLDNEEATIQVGKEVPILSGSSITAGVAQNSVSREDTGIILKITPQISENDTVRLTISQEITDVIESADTTLGPTLDKKLVETVVLAKNKQTIVIGGLIDDKATVSTEKVPLLGDIPVLGTLFRNRLTAKKKSNLIVFITPYIIRERKDYLAVLKKKIEERNSFIDMNYGRSQRKLIRRAISDHASDLLQFKCTVPTEDNPCAINTHAFSDATVPVTDTVQPSANQTSEYYRKVNSKVSEGSLNPPQKIRYRR